MIYICFQFETSHCQFVIVAASVHQNNHLTHCFFEDVFFYNTIPWFVCLDGHAICETCREKLSQRFCPSCSRFFFTIIYPIFFGFLKHFLNKALYILNVRTVQYFKCLHSHLCKIFATTKKNIKIVDKL